MRPLHWSDGGAWEKLRDSAHARYQYLLDIKKDVPADVTQELEKYGFGTVRSVEDFFEFSGVNLRTFEATERGWACGFVENIHDYLPRPIKKPATLP